MSVTLSNKRDLRGWLMVVSIIPGQTALMRIPLGPISVANACVKRFIPAFETAYGIFPLPNREPNTLDTFTIAPFFSLNIGFSACLHNLAIEERFTVIIFSHSSSSVKRK